MTPLDPSRPIQTTEDPPRVVHVVGVVQPEPDGPKFIRVRVPDMDGRLNDAIDLTFAGKSTSFQGSGLTFVNEPLVESSFYPLDRRGNPIPARGLILLSLAESEYETAKYFIEIVHKDGVPTEAKLHVR